MEVQNSTTAAMMATSQQGPQAGNNLGRDDFMRLLMTQMQSQDPLEPMDNTQFTAQLAQFSSLENLEAMTSAMNNMAVSQASNTSALMVSFIGKTVEVANGDIIVDGAGAHSVDFDLAGAAEDVTVTITDDTGRVVRRLEVGALEAGENQVAWDGLDEDGNPVDAGTYTAAVDARDGEDATVGASLRMGRVVSGVTFAGGIPQLMLEGDTTVSLGEVVEVRE